jgi:hypothetical protein
MFAPTMTVLSGGLPLMDQDGAETTKVMTMGSIQSLEL